MNSNLTRSFAALYKILRLSNIYIYFFSKKKNILMREMWNEIARTDGIKNEGDEGE